MTTRNPIDDRSPEIVGSLADRASTMSAAFAPGPWEAFERPAEQGVTGRPSASYVIPSSLTEEERKYPHDYAVARAFTSLNGYDPIAERIANARLMAASPDGYDAAVLALEHMEWSTPQGRAAYEALKAFVAKASGQ